MKTNCSTLARGLLSTILLGSLSASTLQAQTFTGQPKLPENPQQIEATIFPITTAPGKLKLIFNNRTKGYLNVTIYNSIGKIMYEGNGPVGLFSQNIDLSGMPVDTYTLELTKRNEHFSQQFTIEPPVAGHITLGKPTKENTPDKYTDKRLIVSY